MLRRLLLCQVLILSTLLAAVWFGSKLGVNSEGHKLLPPLSGSVLRYGTMGKVLTEQGLLTSTRKNGFQPLNLDDIEAGTTRLTFDIETQVPIRGTVFWHDSSEAGFSGLKGSKVAYFFTKQAGSHRLGVWLDSIDQVAQLRFDVEPRNVKVKISNIELVSDDRVAVMLDAQDDYNKMVASSGVKSLKVDDSGVEFVTSGDSFITYRVDHSQFKESGFTSLFGKKRALTDYSYHSARRLKAPADLPKSITSQFPGLATVSVHAPEGTFDDIYGIVTLLQLRGRKFERPVDISYYDESGKKVFTTPAGIRYHGGYNRAKRASYRFYFRRDYASSKYMPSMVFPEQPLEARSIVLHHTKFPKFSPISHLLAIDLWRAIGVDTPRTKPALLYINGKYDGLYYFTDHISKSNFALMFKATDFKFYRFKSENDQEDKDALYESMQSFRKAAVIRAGAGVDSIHRDFDVEGITNLMIANTVFNTHDYCQGALYRRDFEDEPQWRVIGWDFDGAFLKNLDWTVPVVEDVYNPVRESLLTTRHCILSEIFTHLLKNSPEYRQFFWEKFDRSLSTIYSTEALLDRLNQYRDKYQGKLGISKQGFDLLDDYFRKRPDFVRQQTKYYLDQFDAL